MDSDKIAAYLDKEYPDRPNLFLPDVSKPVDLDSAEYSKAKQAAAGAFRWLSCQNGCD